MTPKAQVTKGGEKQGKKDKLDFIKIKMFTSKDTIKKVKNSSTGWEKIVASHVSDKTRVSRVC